MTGIGKVMSKGFVEEGRGTGGDVKGLGKGGVKGSLVTRALAGIVGKLATKPTNVVP